MMGLLNLSKTISSLLDSLMGQPSFEAIEAAMCRFNNTIASATARGKKSLTFAAIKCISQLVIPQKVFLVICFSTLYLMEFKSFSTEPGEIVGED